MKTVIALFSIFLINIGCGHCDDVFRFNEISWDDDIPTINTKMLKTGELERMGNSHDVKFFGSFPLGLKRYNNEDINYIIINMLNCEGTFNEIRSGRDPSSKVKWDDGIFGPSGAFFYFSKLDNSLIWYKIFVLKDELIKNILEKKYGKPRILEHTILDGGWYSVTRELLIWEDAEEMLIFDNNWFDMDNVLIFINVERLKNYAEKCTKNKNNGEIETKFRAEKLF